MATSEIVYTTRDGEDFTGLLAAPDGDRKVPGILFVTAIWGVDASARAIAGTWADDGFVVSVPDIFWRVHPGPTADREVAFSRYQAFDFEQGLRDVEDLIGHLRAHPRCNGKVAVLGICFGGRYAHLAAARFGIDAAAAYHGTLIEQHLDETNSIACPVSFHFGEDDPVTPMEQVRAIQDSYAGHANADIVAHTGATHNFSLPGNAAYHPAVAGAAHAAVLRCFRTMR
jgi:carboxymethylenebutenolidase